MYVQLQAALGECSDRITDECDTACARVAVRKDREVHIHATIEHYLHRTSDLRDARSVNSELPKLLVGSHNMSRAHGGYSKSAHSIAIWPSLHAPWNSIAKVHTGSGSGFCRLAIHCSCVIPTRPAS